MFSRIAFARVVALLGGVTIRAGSPLPNVKTITAFKALMLAARSITFADPAFGAQSGIHDSVIAPAQTQARYKAFR